MATGAEFFHLRSRPGASWPRVPAPEVAQVWAAYRELERTQWFPAARIAELQLVQLRALLDHCAVQVPYYRDALRDAGLAGRPIESLEQLRLVPIMTRRGYQDRAADLRALALPDGQRETWDGYTSGTNGIPIHVRKTDRDGLWWNALFLRDLEWSGIDPRGRLASIRLLTKDPGKLARALEGGRSPYWSRVAGTLLGTGPSYAMDIRQDPRRQLAWLRGVRPHYLVSYPSNLEHLAGLIEESGDRLPGLRTIQAIGEPLPPAVRERIESGFGVPVRNLYSATEGGYLASPCPSGAGLHVHAEGILAEVLDADDRPCRPGETGRLVFTSLHSFLCPFIRYDILDEVTLAPGPCACGRGLPLWTSVDGRRVPLLHRFDGGRVTSLGLVLSIRQVGGVHQFQLVQTGRDRVLVRVVPALAWSAEHGARMRRAVQEALGAGTRVEIERREWLERPGGGKLRIVVNQLEDRAREG